MTSWLCDSACGCGELHTTAKECCGCSGDGHDTDGAFCFCPLGERLSAEQMAEFEFVRKLPAGAVFSAEYMAANGIHPEQRIGEPTLAREHGGVVTDSPTGDAGPTEPTVTQVHAAETGEY